MQQGILPSISPNRGIVLDPRTKLLLLITMTTFVLGGIGNSSGLSGAVLRVISVVLCILPLILLLTVKKYKAAIIYAVLYTAMYLSFCFAGNQTTGMLNYLLLGTAGIVTRFIPSIMMGAYVVSSTTVSEFTAAMQRMHVSEKLIIPMSVMFRFFPTVADEFSFINTAMRMRGISFGAKNRSKMLEYRLIPLMVCSVKIGEELSVAALTRGLGGTTKRTNICSIGFHIQDWIAIIMCIAPFVFLVMNLMGEL